MDLLRDNGDWCWWHIFIIVNEVLLDFLDMLDNKHWTVGLLLPVLNEPTQIWRLIIVFWNILLINFIEVWWGTRSVNNVKAVKVTVIIILLNNVILMNANMIVIVLGTPIPVRYMAHVCNVRAANCMRREIILSIKRLRLYNYIQRSRHSRCTVLHQVRLPYKWDINISIPNLKVHFVMSSARLTT